MNNTKKPLKTSLAREKALKMLNIIFSGIKLGERKRMIRDAAKMHHEERLGKDI